MTEVTGKVTFGGKDLPGGTIQFFPSKGNFIGAMINPDGTYSVKLLPGSYRVAVLEASAPPAGWKHGDPIPASTPLLPVALGAPHSSGLTAEIEEGSSTKTVDFQLK